MKVYPIVLIETAKCISMVVYGMSVWYDGIMSKTMCCPIHVHLPRLGVDIEAVAIHHIGAGCTKIIGHSCWLPVIFKYLHAVIEAYS